jgi:hypothetical protein
LADQIRQSTLNSQDPEMQLAELKEYAGRRAAEIIEEFTATSK